MKVFILGVVSLYLGACYQTLGPEKLNLGGNKQMDEWTGELVNLKPNGSGVNLDIQRPDIVGLGMLKLI